MFAWLRRKPALPSEQKLRVIDALTDYPQYTPPLWTSEAKSFEGAGEEYQAYFLQNRNRRIEALHSFLAKFGVALSLDDEGARAVSAWLPIYGDLLVDGLQAQESDDLWCAYNYFDAPWTGPLVGFNPIFDLGVFMGECILFRNPRLKWLAFVNPQPNKGARHTIDNNRGRPFDPIHWTYTECKNVHSARMAKKKARESLYGCMKAQLRPLRMKAESLDRP